jgi:hypothetical protein
MHAWYAASAKRTPAIIIIIDVFLLPHWSGHVHKVNLVILRQQVHVRQGAMSMFWLVHILYIGFL